MEQKELPWVCPAHPKANIKVSWDQKQYIMNGYPNGEPIKENYKYECAECGTELASGK